MFGFRATVSASSTLHSPYCMLFGREMTLPLENALDLPLQSTGSLQADEYVKQLVQKLKLIHEVAHNNAKEYQEKSKERYDKGTAETNFAEGTLLWLLTPPRAKKGESKKLMLKYNKLVYVKEKLDNNTYIVIDND